MMSQRIEKSGWKLKHLPDTINSMHLSKHALLSYRLQMTILAKWSWHTDDNRIYKISFSIRSKSLLTVRVSQISKLSFLLQDEYQESIPRNARERASKNPSRKRDCPICGHWVINLNQHYKALHQDKYPLLEWQQIRSAHKRQLLEERRQENPPKRNKEGLTLWDAQKKRGICLS